MTKQSVVAPVEAFYTLCPSDPKIAAYFQLSPKAQVMAMHDILTKITAAVGGTNVTRGRALMTRWQSATKMRVKVPVIDGHAFLTSKIAARFLKQRVKEVDKNYATAKVTESDDAPCPYCVPRPPLHISTVGVYLERDGAPLTVSTVTRKGTLVARVGLRMFVATPFDPAHDAHTGEPHARATANNIEHGAGHGAGGEADYELPRAKPKAKTTRRKPATRR